MTLCPKAARWPPWPLLVDNSKVPVSQRPPWSASRCRQRAPPQRAFESTRKGFSLSGVFKMALALTSSSGCFFFFSFFLSSLFLFFFLFFFFFFFCLFYNCTIVPMRFHPWEIRVAFPKESQLRQSRAKQPTVHAGCFSVSIIYRTLTRTTGSLTCS